MRGHLALSPAAAGIFDTAPDTIICPLPAKAGRPGGLAVFYVDALKDDGSVLYKPLGRSAIRITAGADGVIKARRLAECHGKTIQELRDAGRAFDLR